MAPSQVVTGAADLHETTGTTGTPTTIMGKQRVLASIQSVVDCYSVGAPYLARTSVTVEPDSVRSRQGESRRRAWISVGSAARC
jgi:hypothetical protein